MLLPHVPSGLPLLHGGYVSGPCWPPCRGSQGVGRPRSLPISMVGCAPCRLLRWGLGTFALAPTFHPGPVCAAARRPGGSGAAGGREGFQCRRAVNGWGCAGVLGAGQQGKAAQGAAAAELAASARPSTAQHRQWAGQGGLISAQTGCLITWQGSERQQARRQCCWEQWRGWAAAAAALPCCNSRRDRPGRLLRMWKP